MCFTHAYILFSKNNLQPWRKYLREALFFMWNTALRENYNFYFLSVFASIDKIFILGGRLGTRL